MMSIFTGTEYLITSAIIIYVIALTIFLVSLMDRVDKILLELKEWTGKRLRKR
jgi:hypothetical protein